MLIINSNLHVIIITQVMLRHTMQSAYGPSSIDIYERVHSMDDSIFGRVGGVWHKQVFDLMCSGGFSIFQGTVQFSSDQISSLIFSMCFNSFIADNVFQI